MRTPWMCVLLAGCTIATGGVMSRPAPAPTSGTGGFYAMPDLTGLTEDDAEAKLHALGLTGTFLSDIDLCQDAQIPHLRVCGQSPDAGTQAATESPVRVVLQRASPDSDQPGVDGAHYAMPDVVGLTMDQARAKLTAAGFSQRDHLLFQVDREGQCKPDVICREEPAPGAATTTSDHKMLILGQSPTFYADRNAFE